MTAIINHLIEPLGLSLPTSLGGMLALVAAASFLSLILLALIYNDRPAFVPARREIPQLSPSYPLVGSLPHLVSLRKRGIRFLDEIVRQQREIAPGGKPYSMAVPGKHFGGRIHVCNQPAYIKAVQKDVDLWVKGQAIQKLVGDFLGPRGIFAADGEVWYGQRKLASHIFAVGNFRTQIQDAVLADVHKLDALCLDSIATGTAVALPDVFHRFTLEAFTKLAFGVDLDTLPSNVAGLETTVRFAACFDYSQAYIERRAFSLIPLWAEFLTEAGRKHRESTRYLYDFCRSLIDQRYDAREKGTAESASKGGKDLLQLFIDQGCPREDLPSVIMNFMIAGRDTTAQALSWFMYEMYLHPEIAHRVRKEVWSVLGRAPQRDLEYDDYKHLPYLNAAFYESIRLHPNVPITRKRAAHDTVLRPSTDEATLPGEDLPALPVRKGEAVQFSDYVIARMPEVWGEDCEEFKPERFLTEEGTLKQHSQFLFRAFNSGPRLCLGKNLATYEGMAVIAHMLGKYEIVYDDAQMKENPPTFTPALTLPCTPYHVTFRPLDD